MDQVYGEAVRQMQAFAWHYHFTFVLLHQLNRDAEDDKKAPRLSELRDSGQIEEDSDRVVLLHRKREVDADAEYNTQIIMAKASDAWTGAIDAYFAPQCAGFFGSKKDEGKVYYERIQKRERTEWQSEAERETDPF